MPSRPIIIFILLSWIGATVWFVIQDVLPRSRSDEAPLYVVNQLDEIARRAPTGWRTVRSVKTKSTKTEFVYLNSTRPAYREQDDTFAYSLQAIPRPDDDKRPSDWYLPVKIRSEYRCTREGRLQSFQVRIVHLVSLLGTYYKRYVTYVRCEAKDNQLFVSWEREWNQTRGEWEPLELTYPRRFLLPLHPLNQMTNLRAGQRWKVPTLDLQACTPATDFQAHSPIRWLQAEVLKRPQQTDWRGSPKSCQVVQYTGENLRMKIFVHLDPGGQVLRFEWHQPKESWVIERQ